MYVQDTSSKRLGEAPAATLPEAKECDPAAWKDVFAHWRMALDAVNRINDRLALLTISVDRIGSWNSGPEKIWFGPFRFDHFDQLKRNMQQIRDILRDPKLTIVCNIGTDKYYGKAWPFIRKITLGKPWITAAPHTRTQTLIHEAAHIAGVLNGLSEKRKYEPDCAKKLALQNCSMAMRNAENYGYYALHFIGAYQSADPGTCTKSYPTKAC